MSLNELEQTVLQLLLAGDDPILALLRAQLDAATITSREMTGVGFFTNFDIPESVERTSPENFELSDVHAYIEGVAHGAGFILFIRQGALSCVEGYTYGDDSWPAVPVIIEAYYMHHEPPESAMLRRCVQRDLEQLRANWIA
jgi:hypothetical protein